MREGINAVSKLAEETVGSSIADVKSTAMKDSPRLSETITDGFNNITNSVTALADQISDEVKSVADQICDELKEKLVKMQEDIVLCEQ